MLHAFEAPHLTRTLLFNVFLPGLLFEAGFHIEFKQFWRNRLAITSLALPGVLAAVALTAIILTAVVNGLHFVQGSTWKHALVFGALISATDPIAVVAIFKNLGVPKRLMRGKLQSAYAALEELDRMLHFTHPVVLASLRREYEEKINAVVKRWMRWISRDSNFTRTKVAAFPRPGTGGGSMPRIFSRPAEGTTF
jgi:hypothetical protein